MTAGPLAGQRILVTRPERQGDELAAAIEQAGGIVMHLPLLQIVGRDPAKIRAEAATLPEPQVVIFVSANAARYGFMREVVGTASIAAIGPATRATLLECGATDVIAPQRDFDSEGLLAEQRFRQVRGLAVRIVRGQDGRELLASTLRERGARVDYLCAYERRPCHITQQDRASFLNRLRQGDIRCVTIMSVATLSALLQLLTPSDRELLRHTRLVTPSPRVIQTLGELMPGFPATLAPGPQAKDMLRGLIACLEANQTE